MSALNEQERKSLTVWGDAISVQARGSRIALWIRSDAARDLDGCALLSKSDGQKLRELLNEAHERGDL